MDVRQGAAHREAAQVARAGHDHEVERIAGSGIAEDGILLWQHAHDGPPLSALRDASQCVTMGVPMT